MAVFFFHKFKRMRYKMDYIFGLNMASTSEITLIMVATYIATQITKQTKINNKYMPLLSIVYGMVISFFVGAFVLHDANIYQTILLGFLIGGATSGVFTGVKGIAGGYSTSNTENTVEEEKTANESSDWQPTEEQQNESRKEEN